MAKGIHQHVEVINRILVHPCKSTRQSQEGQTSSPGNFFLQFMSVYSWGIPTYVAKIVQVNQNYEGWPESTSI